MNVLQLTFWHNPREYCQRRARALCIHGRTWWYCHGNALLMYCGEGAEEHLKDVENSRDTYFVSKKSKAVSWLHLHWRRFFKNFPQSGQMPKGYIAHSRVIMQYEGDVRMTRHQLYSSADRYYPWYLSTVAFKSPLCKIQWHLGFLYSHILFHFLPFLLHHLWSLIASICSSSFSQIVEFHLDVWFWGSTHCSWHGSFRSPSCLYYY